jgi:hypothetical protein
MRTISQQTKSSTELMAIDSPVQRDGDQGFLGFASRLNPLTLPAGMLQDSVNMRLERGTAQTRKGAKRLADAISTADEPLTLSFDFAADVEISEITFSGATATVTTSCRARLQQRRPGQYLRRHRRPAISTTETSLSPTPAGRPLTTP